MANGTLLARALAVTSTHRYSPVKEPELPLGHWILVIARSVSRSSGATPCQVAFAVHEEMDEWTCKQDQPWQRTQDVCLMFLPQEKRNTAIAANKQTPSQNGIRKGRRFSLCSA
jgi:hypothetical protein